MERKQMPQEMETLRREAEERVQPKVSAQMIREMDEHDLKRLAHELRVHQVELEMQNETLRETQRELEDARDRFAELFHQAPVGYVEIDPGGRIFSANQTAAELFGMPGDRLAGSYFSGLVAVADRDLYRRFFSQFENGANTEWEEVRLLREDRTVFDARLEGRTVGGREDTGWVIRCCIMDVSEKRKKERELQAARQELRELAGHLQSVREEERTLIAREIHDDVGQVLLYLKMGLSDIETRIPEDDPEGRQKISRMKETLFSTIRSTKSLIKKLRPYVLDELGLAAALETHVREFTQHTGISADFFPHGLKEISLGQDKETALFRICQEALSNVARHSGADHVVVNLAKKDHSLVLEVSDNGIGMKKQKGATSRSYGILGMRERALALGGEVTVDGSSHGTRVIAKIPV
jgi:PAS domain S-box-containing protein